jgi:hypothetical protein
VSDVTFSPGATVADGMPENVRGVSVVTSIWPLPSDLATCTASKVTGATPYSFERVSRNLLPPIEIRIIWRNVLPAKPGSSGCGSLSFAGVGKFRGSVVCRPVAQVPTQLVAAGSPPSPPNVPAAPDPAPAPAVVPPVFVGPPSVPPLAALSPSESEHEKVARDTKARNPSACANERVFISCPLG